MRVPLFDTSKWLSKIIDARHRFKNRDGHIDYGNEEVGIPNEDDDKIWERARRITDAVKRDRDDL